MDGKVDIRDDEEQLKKGQEVLELLVAAGYFRARIKGLSDFDKVVGGLVWCIEVCNVDIDVDLLFEEDSSIGKKIALTEKIVQALNRMKCPFSLEPHQIQGLDYIHLLPIIEWLVKKAIATREAEGDNVRNFAIKQFHKNSQPEGESLSNNLLKDDDDNAGIKSVQEKSKPKRIYRKKEENDDPELTLLEYGQRKLRSSANKNVDKDSNSKQNDNSEGLLDIITETTDGATELNVSAVKSFVDVKELSKAAKAYKESIEKFESETNPTVILNAIRVIDEQKEAVNIRLKAIREENKLTQPSVQELENKVNQLRLDLNAIDQTISEQDLSQDQEQILQKLQHLVTKNETLKGLETTYKEQVREEMEKLLAENEQLESELKLLKNDSEHDQSDEELDKKKLDILRKELAEKGKEVQLLEHQLDAIPSRYELAQYQKRFVELDNQVAAEYSETQQFYLLYNTLQDQKTFMEREIKLLSSIIDTIPDAKTSPLSMKQNFIEQLEHIFYTVKQSNAKTQSMFKDQQLLHDQANEALSKLMELQRTYAVLVRDLQDEMNKMAAT